MEIVEKLPKALKLLVFKYNPEHRKILKKVHQELKYRLRKCESHRCDTLIDIKRSIYYQTKMVNKKHMSYFCCYSCVVNEERYQSNNSFIDIASSADYFMSQLTP